MPIAPRRSTMIAALAAVAAFITVLGGASASAVAAAAPEPVDANTVQVIDADGNAIEGAVIELQTEPFQPGFLGVTLEEGKLDLTTIPGVDPNGVYQMWVWAGAYAGYWDGAPDSDDTQPVRLVSGDTILPVPLDVSNPPPDATSAGISGRVVDALTGLPIPGIQVLAADVTQGGSGEGRAAAPTDVDGEYYMNYSGDVLPGAVQVGFTSLLSSPAAPYGYEAQFFDGVNVSSSSAGTVIPVTAGQTTTGIDASLLPLGQITGLVTEVTPDGITALADAAVSVWNTQADEPFLIASGNTGADGRYALPTPAGSWAVRVDKIVGGNIVATQWYDGASGIDTATLVEVTTRLSTDDIDVVFGTVVPPSPSASPSASTRPVLPATGAADDLTPAALGAGVLLAAGGILVLLARRARRVH